MTKESITYQENRRILLRSGFLSEFDTRANGGIPSNMSYAGGKATFNGTNSQISYSRVLYGVKSVLINVTLTTTTEDILKLSSTHSIEAGSGTVTATGWSSPTIYVDGVATATITTGAHQIIVTTATAFTADDIKYGTVSGFLDGSIDLSVIYSPALTAEEAINLYEGKRFKALTSADEIISVSASSGSIIDRFGATLTNTGVSVFKESEIPYAMYFDGTADINLGQTYTLSRQSAGVEVWFKTKEIVNDRWIVGGTSATFAYIGFNSDGLRFKSNSNGDQWMYFVFANVSINKWHHLIVSADGGTVNSYLDGVLIDTRTPSDDVTLSYIGNNSTKVMDWLGYVGIVKFYDQPLSAAEASQAFTRSRQKYNI